MWKEAGNCGNLMIFPSVMWILGVRMAKRCWMMYLFTFLRELLFGILGGTGSGKSTIVQLLERFYSLKDQRSYHHHWRKGYPGDSSGTAAP